MHIETLEHECQHVTPWHEHTSGQLYWLSQGVIIIETEMAQLTVTPGSLGWFPPGLRHRAWVPGVLKGKSIYLNPLSCASFPSNPGAYGADSFVLALLERVFQSGQLDSCADYQNKLLGVLECEMIRASELPLQLMLPVDRRARNVADELLKNPASMLDQAQLAQRWGLSIRTLSRLFRQQTGLSFSQWRQQAKIVVSLQWVLAGEPVSEVAALSGYSNVSAYIDAFRQRFGKTPGQLQSRGGEYQNALWRSLQE